MSIQLGAFITARSEGDRLDEIQNELASYVRSPIKIPTKASGADLVLCCEGGWKIQAHLWILRTRTNFLNHHIGRVDLEDYYDHFNQLTIVIPNMSHDVLSHCLEVIYTGKTLVFDDDIREYVRQVLNEIFQINIADRDTTEFDVKEEIDFDVETIKSDDDEAFNDCGQYMNVETCPDGQKDKAEGELASGTGNDIIDHGTISGQGHTSFEPGASFNSYRDFIRALTKYCEENYVMWTIGRSHSRKSTALDYERFPKESVVILCHFSGKNKPSCAKGLRKPKKIIEKTDCCFFVSARYARSKYSFVIRGMNLNHSGHSVGPERYRIKKRSFRLKLTEDELHSRPFESLKEFFQIFNRYCEETFVNYKVSTIGRNDNDAVMGNLLVSCVHEGSSVWGSGCNFSLSLRRTDAGKYCTDKFYSYHSGHKIGKAHYLAVKKGIARQNGLDTVTSSQIQHVTNMSQFELK